MGLYARGTTVDIAGISAVMQPVVDAWDNGVIRIVDPNIAGGSFDRSANTKSRTPVTVWEGKARIQAMRWPNVATTRQEAISIRTVVFHLPMSADIPPGVIQEGWRVHVLDAGMAPQFLGGVYVITSSVNTSYAWDRRIETVQDQGVNV